MPDFPSHALRDTFVSELKRTKDQNPALSRFIDKLQAPDFTAAPAASGPIDPTITTPLNQSIETMDCSPDLDQAIRGIVHLTHHYRILENAPVDPGLERGLIAGQIGASELGPSRLGFFLLLPDVDYPLHQHAAEEIYFVVSGHVSIQHGLNGTPAKVSAGEYSVTPPNRLHSLSTGNQICLIVYAWTGEITAPNYWWAHDANGILTRVRWNRSADGLWSRQASETVTLEMMAQAGET